MAANVDTFLPLNSVRGLLPLAPLLSEAANATLHTSSSASSCTWRSAIGAVLARVSSDIIKYLLYARQQIHMPFAQLESAVRGDQDDGERQSEDDHTDAEESRVPLYRRLRAKPKKSTVFLNHAKALFQQVEKTVARGGVSSILVVIGSSILFPDEAFCVMLPNDNDVATALTAATSTVHGNASQQQQQQQQRGKTVNAHVINSVADNVARTLVRQMVMQFRRLSDSRTGSVRKSKFHVLLLASNGGSDEDVGAGKRPSQCNVGVATGGLLNASAGRRTLADSHGDDHEQKGCDRDDGRHLRALTPLGSRGDFERMDDDGGGGDDDGEDVENASMSAEWQRKGSNFRISIPAARLVVLHTLAVAATAGQHAAAAAAASADGSPVLSLAAPKAIATIFRIKPRPIRASLLRHPNTNNHSVAPASSSSSSSVSTSPPNVKKAKTFHEQSSQMVQPMALAAAGNGSSSSRGGGGGGGGRMNITKGFMRPLRSATMETTTAAMATMNQEGIAMDGGTCETGKEDEDGVLEPLSLPGSSQSSRFPAAAAGGGSYSVSSVGFNSSSSSSLSSGVGISALKPLSKASSPRQRPVTQQQQLREEDDDDESDRDATPLAALGAATAAMAGTRDAGAHANENALIVLLSPFVLCSLTERDE